MQHVLNKNGFSYCGLIYLKDGAERLAYQRVGKSEIGIKYAKKEGM